MDEVSVGPLVGAVALGPVSAAGAGRVAGPWSRSGAAPRPDVRAAGSGAGREAGREVDPEAGSDVRAGGAAAVSGALPRGALASRPASGSVARPAAVPVTASVDTTSPGTQPPWTLGRRAVLVPRDASVPRRTRWRQCIRRPFRARP
ncbi:hypothetical protein GCM10023085_80410 [Actinomadura viridis]